MMELRTQRAVDPHQSLHSETGGLPGEHPGRSRNPLIKTVGLAWLEFEKPDLARAERFLADFGFTVTDRTPEALVLRGHWAGTPSLVVRRGAKSGFVGPAFAADARADLDRLASATDTRVVPAPRRPRRRPDRSKRVPGPRGARRPGTAGPAGARPAAAELRPRPGTGQRHPATGPARGADPAPRARGDRHHPVRGGAGLVPGHARDDRQRLPVLRRAARARAGDGVHPLRPGRRAVRPPHPGHGAAAADRVPALGLPGDRPGRGGGRGGVPARARLHATPGGSAGTSRAARSSTTGATRSG